MFGLFKRTKIDDWELSLLKAILTKLSDEYQAFADQVENGLIRGVLIGAGDIPNYVGFSFNPGVHDQYFQQNGINFKIGNVLIWDERSKKEIVFSLYFSFGLLIGYATNEKISKPELDLENITVDHYKKVVIAADGFEVIKELLTMEEKKLVNHSAVYATNLDGKNYYHLKELNDGDFISINTDNEVYKITHDPFEINKIDRNRLSSILCAE